MFVPSLRSITPSGTTSVGIETPANVAFNIELRKKTIEEAMDNESGVPSSGQSGGVVGLGARQLCRVLPERSTNVQASAIVGSTKLYDVTGVPNPQRGDEVSTRWMSITSLW